MQTVRRICAVIATAALMFAGTLETSYSSPLSGSVHHVRNDGGGYVIDYAIKMRKMQRAGRPVHFRGRCDSACTLFLALPRSQTCVAPGAAFGFHLPYGSSARGDRVAASFLLNNYPRWVRNWIHEKGGLSNRLKVMHYDYAKRFLPECPSTRVASNAQSSQFVATWER